MRESGMMQLTREMVKDIKYGLTDPSMKATGKIIKQMEEED